MTLCSPPAVGFSTVAINYVFEPTAKKKLVSKSCRAAFRDQDCCRAAFRDQDCCRAAFRDQDCCRAAFRDQDCCRAAFRDGCCQD
ncbi:hypothetical protein EYF80_066255 [Liparis tanakae]|uniref:Uncharacterized protein n=1 Tax=Liparis tanakae TaxID=230148 RepID=A0A4Z2E4L2_9TELE|nr:hypothetical protein EYF80_066255 [Liparis tanakae]